MKVKHLYIHSITLVGFLALSSLCFSSESRSLESLRNQAREADMSGNLSEGERLWGIGASKGDAQSQNKMGEIAYERRDFTAAFKWFKKAASGNSFVGYYNLGAAYDRGDGVRQSYKEAIKCYCKAKLIIEDKIKGIPRNTVNPEFIRSYDKILNNLSLDGEAYYRYHFGPQQINEVCSQFAINISKEKSENITNSADSDGHWVKLVEVPDSFTGNSSIVYYQKGNLIRKGSTVVVPLGYSKKSNDVNVNESCKVKIDCKRPAQNILISGSSKDNNLIGKLLGHDSTLNDLVRGVCYNKH